MSYTLINVAGSDSRPAYRSPYQKTSSLVKHEAFAVLPSTVTPPTPNPYRNSSKEHSFVVVKQSDSRPSDSRLSGANGLGSHRGYAAKTTSRVEKPRPSRSRLPVVQKKPSVVRPISKSVSPMRPSKASAIPRPMTSRGTSRSIADVAKCCVPLTSSENLPPKRPVAECDFKKSTQKLSPSKATTSLTRGKGPETSARSNPTLPTKEAASQSAKKRDYSADASARMAKTTSKMSSSMTRSKENLSPCSRIPTVVKPTTVGRTSSKASAAVSTKLAANSAAPKAVNDEIAAVKQPENDDVENRTIISIVSVVEKAPPVDDGMREANIGCADSAKNLEISSCDLTTRITVPEVVAATPYELELVEDEIDAVVSIEPVPEAVEVTSVVENEQIRTPNVERSELVGSKQQPTVEVESAPPKTPVEVVAKIEEPKPDLPTNEREWRGIVSSDENANETDSSSRLNEKCEEQSQSTPTKDDKLPEKSSFECIVSAMKPFSWSRLRSKWRSECMRKCQTHRIQIDSSNGECDSRIGKYFRRLRRQNDRTDGAEAKTASRWFRLGDACKCNVFDRIKFAAGRESKSVDGETASTTQTGGRKYLQNLQNGLSSYCTSIRSKCGHLRVGCRKCWCCADRKTETITELERCQSTDTKGAGKRKWTRALTTDLSELDSSFVEHDSIMKGAIPVLPVPLALICLVLNIFLPGFGTFFSGVFCLVVGKARFSINDSIVTRIEAFLINLLVAGSQLCTVIFCLVGWAWSVWWGVMMLKMAKKNKRMLTEQKNKVAVPNPNADPEIGIVS